MVTVKDLEEDKVRALEAGADDHVIKPFRLRELISRLRAILRRIQPQGKFAFYFFRITRSVVWKP